MIIILRGKPLVRGWQHWKHPFFFTLLFLLGTLLPLQHFAQTNSDTLQAVVVSYNKWEQNLKEVPNKIVRVNMQQVALQQPQTAADMLALTGSVFIQKSQLGGGSPMIRGFATNRVLIVVDGVRMNNAIYRSGNLQNVISLDPLSTENAEVIFGPGSLIYGSDAMGGVMDFHTLSVFPIQNLYSPESAPSSNNRQGASDSRNSSYFKGSALLRYASANKEKTVHAHVHTGSRNFHFLTSFTYSDYSDLRMGKFGGKNGYERPFIVQRFGNRDSMLINPNPLVQTQSGYHQMNLLQKIGWTAPKNWRISYAGHFSQTGIIPRYDRLIETAGNQARFGEWNYGPQSWQMHVLSGEKTAERKLYDGIKWNVAFQSYEESRRDRRFQNNNLRVQTENVSIGSLNLDLFKSLSASTRLFYGVEGVWNRVGSEGYQQSIVGNTSSNPRIPIATRYPDGSNWYSGGLYLTGRKTLAKKHFISAGLRYNRSVLNSRFDTSFFKTPFTTANLNKGALTTQLGWVYVASKKHQFSMNIGSGFRSPNIDDIGKIFESVTGRLTVPNADLRAEYLWNTDLSWTGKTESGITAEITLFGSRLNNAITLRPFPINGVDSIAFEGRNLLTMALQNAAYATVWGVQAFFSVPMGKSVEWTIQGNYINGKETDDNRDQQVALRHAPPLYGNTQINWRKKNWLININAVYQGKITFEELAPTERAKTFLYALDSEGNPYCPEWYTLNAKLMYTHHRWQITLGWENITNRQYRPYSSGIVAPGSNVIAALQYKW